MKLYELPERYRVWLNKVEDCDGEVTEDLQKELDAIDTDIATKADAYCGLIAQFKHEEAALREEAKRMEVKAQVVAHRQERLRAALLEAMKVLELDSIRGRRFLVRKSRSFRPAIRWESNERIPEGYRRVIETLDTDAVLKDHTEGAELPEGIKLTWKEFLTIR